VSGPTQMSLADTSTYAAIFTRMGIVPMAVTTSLNMSFLRPLITQVAIADAKLIKLGRTLAVAEVGIRGEGSSAPASHAIVTYALPRE
ncbi:MAG: PaaI family thioesterase, partial [Pseudomonadota bacterium]